MKLSLSYPENEILDSSLNPQNIYYHKSIFSHYYVYDRFIQNLHIACKQPQLFLSQNKGHSQKQIQLLKKLSIEKLINQISAFNIDIHQTKNIIENNASQRKLFTKTSIENRIRVDGQSFEDQLNNTHITTQLIPNQNWRVSEISIEDNQENNLISFEHFEQLFDVQQTNLMVLTIGYLSKIVLLSQKQCLLIDDIFKLALSYTIALKTYSQHSSRSKTSNVSEVLEISSEQLKKWEQYVSQYSSILFLKNQTIDRITSSLH